MYILYGYTLELTKNKVNNVYACTLQLSCINVRFKRVSFHLHGCVIRVFFVKQYVAQKPICLYWCSLFVNFFPDFFLLYFVAVFYFFVSLPFSNIYIFRRRPSSRLSTIKSSTECIETDDDDYEFGGVYCGPPSTCNNKQNSSKENGR